MLEEYQWMTTEELINEAKSKRVPLCTDRRELVLRLLIKHDYGKMKIGELKELALAAGLSAKDSKIRLVENLTNLKMYEITGQSEYLTHSADKKENAEISGNIKQEKPATQKKPAEKGFVQHSVLAKPGRTKLEGQQGTGKYQLQVYTICSVCGEEVYGSYKTETNVDSVEQLPQFSFMFLNCPKCKKKLGLVDGYYIESYQAAEPNARFEELYKKIENIEKEKRRNRLKVFLDNIEPKQDLPSDNNAAQNTLSSLEKLKDYILHLIHMESEIYLLSERLLSLQQQEADNEKSTARAKVVIDEDATKELQTIEDPISKRIEYLTEKLKQPRAGVTLASVKDSLSKTGLFKPQKPTAKKPIAPIAPVFPNMMKPIAPQYKQAGLFNKKRVLAENEELKRKYEEAQIEYSRLMSAYEAERAKYEEGLKSFPMRLSRYENAQKQYESDLKAYNTAYAKALETAVQTAESGFREKIAENEEELKTSKRRIKEDAKQRIKNLPQARVARFLSEERTALMEELKRIIAGRDELYSYNIIYGKYRNFVALTSLYEYLDSGRCSSLDGPLGAYNLFESESRTNEIILQLSAIAASLESIKANQYMLYKELKMVNHNLSEMSDLTRAVIIELQETEAKLDRTASKLSGIKSAVDSNTGLLTSIRNTSAITAVSSTATAYYSAQSAHYAAVNAHYSKINAELTDALGYMVALR